MPVDVRLALCCVAMAIVLLIVTPIFVAGCFLYIYSFGLLAPANSYVLALMVSFTVHAAFFWRVWKFSKTGAAEIGVAVIFFSLAHMTGEVLQPWMMVLGLFVALRPLTDGPEPYGWRPILEWIERRKK